MLRNVPLRTARLAQGLSKGAVPKPCTPVQLQLSSGMKWDSVKGERLSP